MFRTAFTKLGLLALVCFAALAVILLLPSLSCGCGHANKAVCGSNLSTIGKTLSIYGGQNEGRLPAFTDAAKLQWLCDEPTQFTAAILSTASRAARQIFYCPSNTAQDPETMSAWNGIAVTGYTIFNDRGPDAKNMPQDFPKTNPQLAYQPESNLPKNASDTIIAADWIISANPDSKNTGETKIRRPGSPPLYFSTSHLASRTQAAGANVLAADNSVRWRNFTPAPAVAIKQPGPRQIYFWIPNE